MAQGGHLRRRSESVRYVRYFCRADEATAMPLDDPGRFFAQPRPGADVSKRRSPLRARARRYRHYQRYAPSADRS